MGLGSSLKKRLRSVKKTFKKPSIVLRPAYKFISKPIVEFTEEVAETTGEIFAAATNPFLKPMCDILDSLQPRFRLNIDGPHSTISGSTDHRVIVPGLNAPRIKENDVKSNDFTGGLLADLVFNTDELRGMRDDLVFLNKTMRKGLFPHPDDNYEAVILAEVNNKHKTFENLYLVADIAVDDNPSGTVLLQVDSEQVRPQQQAEDIRLLPFFGKTLDDPTTNKIEAWRKVSGQQTAPILEQRLPLSFGSQKRNRVEIDLRFLNEDGKTPASEDSIKNTFEGLEVRINRVNGELDETLHRFSWDKPNKNLCIPFQIDRRGLMSQESPDFQGEKLIGSNVDGGGLRQTVSALQTAIEAIDSIPTAIDSGTGETPKDTAISFLLDRIQKTETVRESLWKAKNELKEFRPEDGKLDYRLRFKLRIDNPNVERKFEIHMKNEDEITGSILHLAPLRLEDITLPIKSVYETTVYPIKISQGMKSTLKIRSDNETNASLGLTLVSLLTTYGGGEVMAKSQLLKKENSNPGAPDVAEMVWEVKDMTSYASQTI